MLVELSQYKNSVVIVVPFLVMMLEIICKKKMEVMKKPQNETRDKEFCVYGSSHMMRMVMRGNSFL